MLIKTMLVKIGADVSDLTKKFNQVSKKLDDNKKKIQSSLNKVSFAVAGVGIAAVKMAADFNKSMANIATLIPEKGVKRVNELKSSIQDLAIATGESTGSIADGAYQVISAIGDTADTVKILETNVKAAAAGMATTTDAINLTSAVTKGYGDASAEAFTKVSDLAFTTVKLGQTTFPELANSIGSVVPIAKKLNVSQEELFGTFAAFTGVTGDASKVATQFEGVLGALIKPSEEMIVAMDECGYKTGEAMIADLGLIGAMEKLISKTDGTSIGIGKLITRKEGLTLAMAMTGAQSDTLKEKIGAMGEAAGGATTAFETMTGGVNEAGFRFQQAKQRIAVMMQTLGDQLLPVVADIVEAFQPLVTLFTKIIGLFAKLPAPLKTVVLAFGGLVAAAAPMFKMFAILKADVIPMVIAKLAKLKAAIMSLTLTTGVLVAALAALVIGYMKVKKARDAANESARTAKEVEDGLFRKLKAAADQAGLTEKEFLKLRDAYHGSAAAMAMAIKRGKEGEELQKALADVSSKHKDEVDKQKGAVLDLAGALGSQLNPKLGETEEKTKSWLDLLKETGILTINEKIAKTMELKQKLAILDHVYEEGKVTLQDYLEATKNIRDEMHDLGETVDAVTLPAARDFSDVVSQAPGKLKAIVPAVEKTTKKVKSAFTEVSQRIKDVWTLGFKDMILKSKSFGDVLKGTWGAVKEQFATLVSQLVTKWTVGFIENLLDGSKGLLGGLKETFSGIGSAISGIFGKTKDVVGDAAGAAADAAGKVADSAGEMSGGFLSNITKLAGPLGIGLLIGKIIGFKNITKTVQDVWKAVSENLVKYIEGVGKVIDAVFGAVADIVGGIGKAIGGLLGGIGGLLQKKGLGKTAEKFLQQIVDNTKLTRDALFIDILPMFWELVKRLDQIRDTVADKSDAIMGRIDSVKSLLGDIRGYAKSCSDKLKSIPTAQTGAHFDRPTLALVGEVPETVIPDRKLSSALARSGSTTLNAVFNIHALDPRSIRDIVRSQVGPEFIEYVRAGLGKTKLKEALL